jgi:hypothetical protein
MDFVSYVASVAGQLPGDEEEGRSADCLCLGELDSGWEGSDGFACVEGIGWKGSVWSVYMIEWKEGTNELEHAVR